MGGRLAPEPVVLLLGRPSDLAVHSDLAPRFRLPDVRAQRLAVALQALDGRLAAASYREIAVAPFGVHHVGADGVTLGIVCSIGFAAPSVEPIS